ncbi:hypothetical protein [Planctomycetes bacterium K23_9]|uniref:Secreted protein n=1 Tax=Stieleria marina TaxID=1930275 RepID=A0A517NTE1_9BACT|nr:hypothetical protein K239x_23350 [Planctomycetes bacterium K23_9]
MARCYKCCSSLLFLSFVVALGCDNSATPLPKKSVLAQADKEDASVPAASQSDITDEESGAFGLQWAKSLSEGDVPTASQLIDWDGILDRSMDGLTDDPKFRSGFKRGATPALGQLVRQIAKVTQGTGTYELVGVVRRNGEPHVVHRLIDDQGAMNYHDLHLRRDGTRIVGDELFIAASGEAFSDTLRGLVGTALQSQRSIVDRISGQSANELKRLENQMAISRAVQAGNKAEALRLYGLLTPDLKKQKIPMLYRIMATDVEDEAAYSTAVNEYIRQFPEDASVGLISIDAAVMGKNPELLAKAHKALTGWTGGDELLDMMIAANFAAMDEVEMAKEIVKDVDVSDSKDANIHDYRLAVALAADEHAETLARLRSLRDDFGYEFTDLRQAEGFERFAASSEFQEWLAE